MIYKLNTKTQDTYSSTVIIGGKVYHIDCKAGIITTDEIELVNHLVDNLKFAVIECKETKVKVKEKEEEEEEKEKEETIDDIKERINKIRGIKKLEKMLEEEIDTQVKKIISKRIKELS